MTKFHSVSNLVTVSDNIVFILDGTARFSGINGLASVGLLQKVMDLSSETIIETYSLIDTETTVILLPSEI